MVSGAALLRLGVVAVLCVGSGSLAAEPDAPEQRPVQWQTLVGGMAALDGYSSLGHQGLLLGFGWEGSALRLRFQFMAGMPVELRDDRTVVSLAQYTAGLWLDTRLLTSGPWRWSAGAGAGALLFSRDTKPLFQGVEPAQLRFIPSLLVGPDTSVRWRASRLLALEASAAVDVVLGRPILGYVTDAGFDPRERGWAVRPRLTLALMVLP